MKNVLKNPLKIIIAAMFVVTIGFGMNTSLKVSENNGSIDLLALTSAVAQGESGFPCGTCKGSPYYCGGYVGGPCGVKYMSL